MMKAEMTSETSKSRAQTATTGSERAPDSFVTAVVCGSGLPTSGIVFTFYTQAGNGARGGRAEVRGQIAEVKNKVGFYLCNLTSHL